MHEDKSIIIITILLSFTLQWRQSSLYAASFCDHQKCVELLLEAGAIVDVQKEVSVRVSVVVFIISISELKYSSNRR